MLRQRIQSEAWLAAAAAAELLHTPAIQVQVYLRLSREAENTACPPLLPEGHAATATAALRSVHRVGARHLLATAARASECALAQAGSTLRRLAAFGGAAPPV